jgi:hypothetical protein
MIKKFAGLLALITCLTGCLGPVYKTNRQYIAPQSSEGKMCLNGCLSAKNSCQHSCRSEQNTCEVLNSTNRMLHMSMQRSGQRDPYYYDRPCSSYACENSCEEMHDQCYVNCGGHINYHTYCSAFCDQQQ